MPFVKVIKNKAYFKRFQVKFRRRREGKTDYRARKRLITNDKYKYDSPKYRLVVRFSNRDITVQVVRAKIIGDEVLTAAYAHELPGFGLKVGLTNYAAAYCVGLLAARRLLTSLNDVQCKDEGAKKFQLANVYEGNTAPDGNVYLVEEEDGPRPFKALLDVGLKSTTTGARVFAAMKGATDGGLYIPHNEKRFVGYDAESKSFDADTMRSHIFGGHVGNYMEQLQDEDPEAFKKQFSQYIKNGVKHDGLEAMYSKVHSAIRKNPVHKKKAAKSHPHKRWTKAKLSKQQRQSRVEVKIANRIRKLQEAAGADSSSEEESD